MLIEAQRWQADKLTNGMYMLKIQAMVSMSTAYNAQNYIAIYVKDNEHNCDMCCPTCGKSL